MKIHEYKTVKERRQFLEKHLSINLTNIEKTTVDTDEFVHCENRIGSVSVPLGVAGPFVMKGENIKGEHYLPLATTEGALVASVSRGAKACLEHGITTTVERVGVTRGPVLKVSSPGEAKKVEAWIWDNRSILGRKAEETSHHLKLTEVDVKTVGLYVFVRFNFDTDRAMGMNMATIATQYLADYIQKKTKARTVSVAGNYDVDKKPSWLNSIKGRGFVVRAETIISEQNVESILKTSVDNICEVWRAKCLIGSALSGSMGFNAHHANIVAAFFLATGQDLAHVVGGSVGMTVLEALPDGSLYAGVYLPDIMMGSVGGGTGLQTQKEARSLLKTDSPLAMSEILGAGVLAGEVSLLASLSQGTLARAHKALGR